MSRRLALVETERAESDLRQITVNWRRLEMALWRTEQGDIDAAYSAESFPKVRAFQHQGQFYTNLGGWAGHSARCHPLIPAAAYAGAEPARLPGPRSREGERVTLAGKAYRLGPPVEFIGTDLTVEEWRWRLKVMYADGGVFAANKPYVQMLQEFQARGLSPNKAEAIKLELSELDLPTTQREMFERLAVARATPPPSVQLDLPL